MMVIIMKTNSEVQRRHEEMMVIMILIMNMMIMIMIMILKTMMKWKPLYEAIVSDHTYLD